MVIAIEKTLNNLKAKLENAGYIVEDAETYKGAVDAYVYENNGFFRNGTMNNILQNSTNDIGILMVNAKNKTAEEVMDILNRRIYGNILKFI